MIPQPVFHGYRQGGVAKVEILVKPPGAPAPIRIGELPPGFEAVRHSPTGFEWGYCGSGPAQLAYAMLARCVRPATAMKFYQLFKLEVVSLFTQEEWFYSVNQVHDWFEEKGVSVTERGLQL